MSEIATGISSRRPRGRDDVKLRHYCRYCRSKLPTPVENEHHAFCCRGCHSSFYRSRCLVCEEPMRRKRESQKLGSGHKTCEVEYRKFPRVYGFPVQGAGISDEGIRSAHSTGLKIGLEGGRPPFRCLAHYRWGGDPDRFDHSLYDKDGLTVARIVLQGDGRYHLHSPVTWPRMSWPDLDEAKRRAMSMALAAMPLEAGDPKLAARIKRDNGTPHPMGPPLNRRLSQETATASDWRPTGDGADMLDLPGFLRRAR